jgi:type II secretory pathway component PulF
VTHFRYEAADASGQTIRGIEEADTPAALERMLSGRGLYALRVVPAERGGTERGERSRWVSRRADVAEAVATLAALLEAGLPLEQALEVAAKGAARADVSAGLEDLRRTVRGGGRIAEGVRAHPALFPPVAAGLLAAGERGGQLADAARRLADGLEREGALRASVVAAVTYPALLALVGTGATGILLGFVLPKFVGLLAEAGARLPLSTSILLAFSKLVTSYGWVTAALLVTGAVLLWRRRRSPAGRERIDAWLLRVPMVGGLRARYASAQVARTLATLLAGGVPLLTALEVAVQSVTDAAVSADLNAAHAAVRRGDALSGALSRGRGFPHVLVRLVEVGERTGELDAMLLRAAALMEAELERRLGRAVALLEPLLVLFFGFLVGGVALSLLQAIYGMHSDAL